MDVLRFVRLPYRLQAVATRLSGCWGKHHYVGLATARLRRSAGVSFLEVVVSVAILSIGGTAVVGGLAGGLVGTDQSTARTILKTIAQSQLDFVATQTYRDDGAYEILTPVPPGYQVELQVTTLRPGFLHEITTLVGRTGSVPIRISTYHSNRLLETGSRPQSAGLEGTRPIPFPAEVNPGQGVFQVVQITPSAFLGQLRARWQLTATPPLGLISETRALSVSIFPGTPFGLGPQGTSLMLPADVGVAPLATAEASDLVVDVFARNISPGTYTLYFYNRAPNQAATAGVEVSCICPR